MEQIVFTKGYNYASTIIAWEKDNPLMEVLQIEKIECDLNPEEGERNVPG